MTEINAELNKNLQILKKRLVSDDIVFCEFGNAPKYAVVYDDPLVDKDVIAEFIIRPLKSGEETFVADVTAVKNLDDAITEILGGKALIFTDGKKKLVAADVKKFDTRAVMEPPTTPIIKGPREGFTECLKTNQSLVRRRIKHETFIMEKLEVGKYTKTAVLLCYVSSIARDDIVSDLRSKINSIDIDCVLDSAYVGKFLVNDANLFKQAGTTEKPDVFCAKLLEGRVGVLVDGSPIAITLPYMFLEDFQSAEDYYVTDFRAISMRILRVVSIFLAVMLPAFFVSAQLFHLQIIPLNFLLTIVNSIKGIPLSPSYEMFFTLLIFEILNEASIRMPKYVGMALSIVGALVLGDTAVRAGIVSSPTIMITALSGICIYTVPDLSNTMSILRIIFLIIAGSVGGYGIIVGMAVIAIVLSDLTTYDSPLLAPYSPLVRSDLKDGLFKKDITENYFRPAALKPKNKRRLKTK